MSVFDAYAEYYNLLYRDKDYLAEVAYLQGLIDEFMPNTISCLNLGCGTGNHDFIFAQTGMEMLGVDLSEAMITAAKERLTREQVPNLAFRQGDIRSLELNRKFDVVMALFHVMSYQASDQDLKEAFDSVNVHLKPGGIFIFDSWYGPAVLEERPEERVKHMENNEITVKRKATPVMKEGDNTVEVHYDLSIVDKSNNEEHQFSEQHNMRYLFTSEVEELLAAYDMQLIHSEEFLSEKELSSSTWSSLFVARKIG